MSQVLAGRRGAKDFTHIDVTFPAAKAKNGCRVIECFGKKGDKIVSDVTVIA